MRLPEVAVRRRITFLMVFILMTGLGVYGFSLLGLDFFPELATNRIIVFTVLPGAGPEEVETLVSEVVEDAVALVGGVETIESSSSSNMSIVTIEFSWGTDIDQAEIDVRNALSLAGEDLPDDAQEPMVLPMDPSMTPATVVYVGSDIMNDIDLRRTVDDEIGPMLNRIEGVASVTAFGGLQRQINVQAEPVLMELHGISMTQVAAALAPVRNNTPAGKMVSGGMDFVLNVETAFHDISEIEGLVVGFHDGMPVHVGDIATVEDGTEELTGTMMVDGERSILIMVFKRTGSNTVEVCRNVIRGLEEIDGIYGNKVSTGIVYDQSQIVRESVNNLGMTGIQAVVIAVLVLLFFLGSWRNSGVVALSIPLSVFLTFPVMALLHVNLNMVSLAGLALAVGMLVDNSIVVLENIFRHRTELGESPGKAAVEGTGEVGMAISASTLTTLAVFVPIVLVPGITGQLFRDLSLTISSTLLVSLFVALTLIPLATSRMKHVMSYGKSKGLARRIDGLLDSVASSYAKSLSWATSRKKIVISGAFIVFLLALALTQVTATEFIPTWDDALVQFIIYRSPGTELGSTDSTMSAIVAELEDALPVEVWEHIYFTAGESEGVLALTGASGTNEAMLVVKLTPSYTRDLSKMEIEQMIRDVVSVYPDVEYSRNDALISAFMGGDPLVVNVYGNDITELTEIGEELVGVISDIDGVEEARSSLSHRIVQLSFVPDYTMLSLRAASPVMMGYEANLAFMGSDVSIYRENAEEYDVNLRYPPEYRSSLSDLSATVISGLPMEAWGSIEEHLIPKSIMRRNQSRVVTVTGSLSGSRTLGQITPDLQQALEGFDLRGNSYEIGGQIEDQIEAFKGLLVALIAAAILVYMVMASQFESLLEPFIIILTVPLAFSGAIFMLILTGTTLSVLSFTGIVMLAGIIVNNGIVLVDYANQLLSRGRSRLEAILEAAGTRLRPILMTATTTAIALIPMAIGSGEGGEIYGPMGRSVIGGLALGTLLTLFVVPCLYLVLGRFKKAEKTVE